jgi:hypothetical protein
MTNALANPHGVPVLADVSRQQRLTPLRLDMRRMVDLVTTQCQQTRERSPLFFVRKLPLMVIVSFRTRE